MQNETSKKDQTTRCRPSTQHTLLLGNWCLCRFFWAQMLLPGMPFFCRMQIITYKYKVSAVPRQFPKGLPIPLPSAGDAFDCIQHGDGSNTFKTDLNKMKSCALGHGNFIKGQFESKKQFGVIHFQTQHDTPIRNTKNLVQCENTIDCHTSHVGIKQSR